MDADAALARKASPRGAVLAGPFAGLLLPVEASWGNPAAYLSGVYEHELQPWIERLILTRPPRVIDIGAAEGYYAVGLARRLPQAEVYAFDVDPEAHRALRRAIRLNGVANVRCLKQSTRRNIERHVVPRALVICDCEGCELEILDPSLVPSLRTATIVAELHDFVDPTISRTLIARFAATHEIHVVTQQAESHPKLRLDHLAHLTAEETARVTDERRPAEVGLMQWAVMLPMPSGRS